MPQIKSSESSKEGAGQNLELVTDLAQSLISELKSFSANHENLKSQFKSVSDDVEKLSIIIREGNGKPSLITTIALLEKDFSNLKKELDKLELNTSDSVDELTKELNELKKTKSLVDELVKWKDNLNSNNAENTRGKWQLRAATLSGSMALITAIVSMIFQFIIKK